MTKKKSSQRGQPVDLADGALDKAAGGGAQRTDEVAFTYSKISVSRTPSGDPDQPIILGRVYN